jgi:hypothetical protein
MTDTRLHNDCDGGDCFACAADETRAKGPICETCYWWLGDSGLVGICRRYRPSAVHDTFATHTCREHSFESPYNRAST